MAIKAIQQFQLRTVIGTEAKAKETLRLMEEAGYDAIEVTICNYASLDWMSAPEDKAYVAYHPRNHTSCRHADGKEWKSGLACASG